MKKGWIFLLIAGLALAGCKTPGDMWDDINEKVEQKLSRLSLMVSDNLSLDFKEVWIGVRRLEGDNDAGQTVVFYDNPEGQVFNIVSREGVAQLLSTQQIPAGNYQQFRLQLMNQVTLVRASGSEVTLKIRSSGDTVEVVVPAKLDVLADKVQQLALKFDLSGIDLTNLTWAQPLVTLVTDLRSYARSYANVQGEVLSVDTTGRAFRFMPADSNVAVTAKLHQYGVVADVAKGQVANNVSLLQAGQQVDVYGNYHADGLSLQALAVNILEQSIQGGSSSQAQGRLVEVEGHIVSLDVNSLQLDLDESSFLPDSGLVEVIDLANALYSRGDYASLAVGQELEILGYWDGMRVTAALIEIEGAAPAGLATGDLFELEGRVQSVTGQQLAMQVTESESANWSVGETVTLDISQVWYEHGDAACLKVGAEIEVKFLRSVTALTATVIEVESDCALSYDDFDSDSDSDSDSDDESSEDESSEDESDDS